MNNEQLTMNNCYNRLLFITKTTSLINHYSLFIVHYSLFIINY